MKYMYIALVTTMCLFLLSGCEYSVELNPSPHMRCPEWAQYDPDSKCDVAVFNTSLGSSTVNVDMTQYDITRMVVLDYDVIVVEWANVRIETDRGEKVLIDQSRLLPGAYIVHNEIFDPNVIPTEEEKTQTEAFFNLINPQGNDSTEAELYFESVRPARPLPTPTPETTE